jgi:hypothetical protein
MFKTKSDLSEEMRAKAVELLRAAGRPPPGHHRGGGQRPDLLRRRLLSWLKTSSEPILFTEK